MINRYIFDSFLSDPTFTPPRVPDIALWLDSSQLGTIDHTLDQVDTWHDIGPNGFNATKPSGLNAPLTNQATRNGNNVLRFSRSSSRWLECNGLAPLGISPLTISYVLSVSDLRALGYSFVCMGGFHNSGNNANAFFIHDDGFIVNSTTGPDSRLCNNGWVDSETWYMVTFRINTSNIDFFINGTLVKSGATGGALPATTFNIGQDFDAAVPSDYYDGYIGEIFAYSRSLSNDEIGELYRRHAKSKWSLQDLSYLKTDINNILFWIDPTLKSTVNKDGSNLVSEILSLDNSFRTATQVSAPNKMLWATNQLFNYSGLVASANQYMNISAGACPIGNNNYSIYMVAKNNADNNNAYYYFFGSGADNQALFLRRSGMGGSDLNVGWWNNNLVGGFVSNIYTLVSTFYNNAVGRENYISQALTVSDSQTSRNQSATPGTLCANFAVIDCIIVEMVVVNGYHSLEQKTQYFNYFLKKYPI